MKNFILLLAVAMLAGCVSFGVECTSSSTRSWVRVHRFGWGITNRQVDHMAKVKKEVCE
jgi:hypothetical protein